MMSQFVENDTLSNVDNYVEIGDYFFVCTNKRTQYYAGAAKLFARRVAKKKQKDKGYVNVKSEMTDTD